MAWFAATAFGAVALAPGVALDRPGRLLCGIAAVALVFVALVGTRARPRLAADLDGIEVRGLTSRTRYPWSEVERVHVVRTRRWGRETPLLEIDTRTDDEERLLVFGRLDLGTDPEEVSERLAGMAGSVGPPA